ncbi:hypothetical protein [uncultured Chryseobacterium sp.]|uniref:hypothetical protein n=1 Tax=uncultured Chryseobacterium sp. TaxID=259322 RepID=UPI0025E5E3FE|nr:hypothetical protein [uncultured Chryseobacterium sp.]
MKNKFLHASTVLCLAFLTSCSATTDTEDLSLSASTASVKNSTQNKLADDSDEYGGIGSGSVTTVWTIGRKSRECGGIGICKLTKVKVKIESIEATVYGNRMFAAGVKVVDPNRFILQVDEENMLDIVKEFGGKHLILEEDLTISAESAEELGLSENFIIKKGIYDFLKNESNGFYEVKIVNN